MQSNKWLCFRVDKAMKQRTYRRKRSQIEKHGLMIDGNNWVSYLVIRIEMHALLNDSGN